MGGIYLYCVWSYDRFCEVIILVHPREHPLRNVGRIFPQTFSDFHQQYCNIFSQSIPRGYRLRQSRNYVYVCVCLCVRLLLSPHPPPVLPIQYNTIQYNTTQYNTIQYNTIQYIQYNTIQYNTIQYNKIQYNTIQYI